MQKLNSADADSETPRGLPHATYVLIGRRAAALKVAHPLMLRAIAAAKKKNDRIDANKICDCLRCDFLPECYMAATAIRERRRSLRYRNLLVRQMVQMDPSRVLGENCSKNGRPNWEPCSGLYPEGDASHLSLTVDFARLIHRLETNVFFAYIQRS